MPVRYAWVQLKRVDHHPQQPSSTACKRRTMHSMTRLQKQRLMHYTSTHGLFI